MLFINHLIDIVLLLGLVLLSYFKAKAAKVTDLDTNILNSIAQNLQPDDRERLRLTNRFNRYNILPIEYDKSTTLFEYIKREKESCMASVVNQLQKLNSDPKYLNDCLIYASTVGAYNAVKVLLKNPNVNPAADYSAYFPFADCDHMDPKYAIINAAINNHPKIVRLLLEDGRSDPSARNNYAIRRAARNGYANVVRELINSPKVDPSAGNNYAILRATFAGYFDVVRVLLQDRRVNPTARYNYALKWAAWNGHQDMPESLS